MLAFLFHTALAAEPGLCLILATVEGDEVRLEPLICEAERVPDSLEGLELESGEHVVELQPHFQPETAMRLRPDLDPEKLRSGELRHVYTPSGQVGLELPGQDTELPGVMVHWSQVKPRRKQAPQHQPTPETREAGPADCKIGIAVDATGTPVALSVEGCAEVYHGSCAQAVWASSYHPPSLDRGEEPRDVHFLYMLKF